MLNLALLGAKISQREQLLRQASLWLAPVRTGSLVSLASRTMPITFSRSTTTTFLGKDGLLKTAGINVPVIEYDVNGNCLGLRVWGAVTNFILQSENLGASWALFNSSPSLNSHIAPDGTLSADSVTPSNGLSDGLSRQDISGLPDNTSLSAFVFVKAAGINVVNLQFYNKANTFHFSGNVNLTTGAIETSPINMSTEVLRFPNGWYQIRVTGFNSGSGATTPNLRIASSVTGNGSNAFVQWGAQVNPGPLAPYVPTTTTAASSTADVMTITGEDFSRIWNPLQGTMFFDGSFVQTGVASYPRLIAAVGANPGTDEISIYTRNGIGTGDGRFFGNSCVSGSDVFTLGEPTSPRANSGRAAFAFTANNAAFYDGAILTTDNTGSLPTVQELRLMGQARFQGQPVGYIREAAIFRNVLPSRSLVLLAQ